MVFCYLFPRFAMTHSFRFAAAVIMGVLIAAPGLAYFAVPGNSESSTEARSSRRSVMQQAEGRNRLQESIPAVDRSRESVDANVSNGRFFLRRAEGRHLRRYNRTAKPGFDRYRVLNVHMNKRSARRTGNQSLLGLPHTLVETGGYDRPTRRDIWQDHSRNLLREMREGSM